MTSQQLASCQLLSVCNQGSWILASELWTQNPNLASAATYNELNNLRRVSSSARLGLTTSYGNLASLSFTQVQLRVTGIPPWSGAGCSPATGAGAQPGSQVGPSRIMSQTHQDAPPKGVREAQFSQGEHVVQ